MRNHKAKSYVKQFQKNNVLGFTRAFTLSLAGIGLCAGYGFLNTPVELVNPLVAINYVQPQAVQAVSVPEEAIKPVFDNEIEAYIYEVYGDKGETMVKLFTCESGLKPETIGDKHLMGMLDGEMIGDSVGIAQIRTGNAPGTYDKSAWNRAKANGMTVEEFRTKLQDPYYNIDYSKKIYERQGIGAWSNCAKKVRIL